MTRSARAAWSSEELLLPHTSLAGTPQHAYQLQELTVFLVVPLQGGAYCQLPTRAAGQPATVTAKSATYTALQSCQIQVAFPSFHVPAVFVPVNVVVMQSLVLRSQNYDYTSAQGSLASVAAAVPQYQILQQIKCNTSDYEQVHDHAVLNVPVL